MNSTHEMWTEVWGTSGIADILDGATMLDADLVAKITASITFAGSNSYTTGSMDDYLLQALKQIIMAHTTPTD